MLKEFNHSTDLPVYTLQTLRTPRMGRILAKVLLSILGLLILILFLPWQQNIRGTGKVTAFTPGNRPQSVESAIDGRIGQWHIQEGEFVERGDTLLTLSEINDKYFDPQLLERLSEQLSAKESSILSKREKAVALRSQLEALEKAMEVKYRQGENKLKQARFKLVSDSVDYEAEKVRYANAGNLYERNRRLYGAGNIALTKFQEIESKYQEAKMKVVSSENKWQQAKSELQIVSAELAGIRADYRDKISKARSELSATLSEVYESEAARSKLRNEYANMTIRNEQYQVIAPQSGYIVRALQSGIGETITAGEPIATISPENPDMAVEMYVRAMDVPLISRGRKVRIEFDGWPALQFSGWPSVSVGSFGGIVQVIDNVNQANGQFRILVTPDPDDQAWPEQLRIGSGTKGWVMLENVPIWYEIWRQLNGFPPSLYEEPAGPLDKPAESSKKEKKK